MESVQKLRKERSWETHEVIDSESRPYYFYESLKQGEKREAFL